MPHSVLTKWQRKSFLAFDTFLAASSLGLLSIGMAYHVSYVNTSFEVNEYNTNLAAILFIVVGSITFPVAYFGFYAVVNGQPYMIRNSSLVILALAVLTISIGLLFVTFVYSFKSNLCIENIASDRWTNRNKHIVFWNTVHFLLECCGYGGGYAGWLPELPSSCCFQQSNNCQAKYAYKLDCKNVGCNGTTGYANGYVAVLIGVLELIGSVFIFRVYWNTIDDLPKDALELKLDGK